MRYFCETKGAKSVRSKIHSLPTITAVSRLHQLLASRDYQRVLLPGCEDELHGIFCLPPNCVKNDWNDLDVSVFHREAGGWSFELRQKHIKYYKTKVFRVFSWQSVGGGPGPVAGRSARNFRPFFWTLMFSTEQVCYLFCGGSKR